MLFVEAPDGVVLMTREQAKALVRKQLAGSSLVEELLADRRAAAGTNGARTRRRSPFGIFESLEWST